MSYIVRILALIFYGIARIFKAAPVIGILGGPHQHRRNR